VSIPSAVAAAAAMVALAIAGTPPAAAATSVESGWWTTAPVALGPDVGGDQLLVHGSADPARPLAYAGLSFTLVDGDLPQTLVLTVAPASGTTPGARVSLCALGAPATPSQGEPADLGPAFDCGNDRVDSTPASDGASYTFDVAGFVRDGAIDVALVPAGPTDRVVFVKPTVDALKGGATVVPSSDSGTGAGVPEASATTDPGDVALGSPDALELPPLPGAASAPPAATVVAPRDGRASPGTRVAPVAATRAAVAAGGSRSLAPFVFGGLGLAAAALWALAGNASPEPATDSGGGRP
jgi:hypothetical protein